jgi:hypothetical protein
MAINAAARLVASRTPKVCAVELPNFRYLDDVSRFLDSMREDAHEAENLIAVQQKALAHLKSPRQWVQAALTKSKSSVDPQLKKIVVPSLSKLETQYGLSEELYERYRTLEAIETQIAAQFPDRKGAAYERAISGVRELKKKVGAQMKTVLQFLTEIANSHVPKTFTKYRQALANTIEDNLAFDNSSQFLYVNTNAEGQLMFTNYVMIEGARAADGRTVPHLYISLQWVVSVGTYVQVNHEFELPESLDRSGVPCVGLADSTQHLSAILAGEGFELRNT